MSDSINIKLDTRVLDNLIRQGPDEVDRFLRTVGNLMVADIKQEFGTSPAGRTYRRGSVSHTASKGGYPPNVDTGALRSSVTLRKVGDGHYEIHDQVKYGVFLEMGSSNGKLAARPWMRPIFESYRAKVLEEAQKGTFFRG